MDHFRPHTHRTFEGYYSKFTLPSGATVALVICSVPKATVNPHMVSLTYVPKDFPNTPHFQRELWIPDIQMINHPPPSPPLAGHNLSPPNNAAAASASASAPSGLAFELHIPKVGSMRVHNDHTTDYDITDPSNPPSFTFTAHVPGSTRVPYHRDTAHSTPEDVLIHLPLPLHWHVHSLASRGSFTLHICTDIYPHLSPLDDDDDNNSSSFFSSSSAGLGLPGRALVHLEKNWATSFPHAHTWLQAYNPRTHSGVCLAGGSILGTQAYLLTYHAVDPTHDISFTPPWTMALSSVATWLSPCLRVDRSWAARTVRVRVMGLTRGVEITAEGKQGAFVGISAPFADGHRLNSLGECFDAVVSVKVWARTWTRAAWGGWEVVCAETFEGAALEFGGDIYGARGSETWVN